MDLLPIINRIRENKALPALQPGALQPESHLRNDLQMDSLDLAELTVRVEAASGVDIFADGIVQTIGEIQARLDAATNTPEAG